MLLELHGLLASEAARDIVRELAAAPFANGKVSAHGAARGAKNNLRLDPANPISQRLGGVVLGALAKSEVFRSAALPHTILPLTFSRYLRGMAYGDHLDLPVMGTPGGPLRTDLSITVWLSPKSSYQGGELILRFDTGERVIKGESGDATLYPSTTLHRVSAVTGGERVVAVSWIQSLVRDPEHRAILFSLTEAASAALERGADRAELARLTHIHHRLLRLWADC